MSRLIKLLEKRLLFRDMTNMSIPAIYALVNEKHKRIYILSTRDLGRSLAHQASLLGKRTHSIKQLKRDKKYVAFKLLETYSEPPTRADLFVDRMKWLVEYKEKGYTLYDNAHIPRYYARTFITDNFRCEVQIVSSGRRVYPVAQFKTQIAAQDFIANNSINSLIKLAKNSTIK